MVKSQPPHLSDNEDACRLVGFNWCKMNVKYGDVQDGLHLVNNVRVGPYLLIPEVEMNLRFLFTVYNFGDSYTARLGEAIANGFSTAGMIFLKGADTTGSDAAESLDEAMKALHAAAFAGCDGYMAVDTVVLVNQTVPEQPDATLDALTRATGVYRPAATKIYEGGQYADGNTRCGAGGRYKVTYAVHRTSWRQQ
jgi:hypothetical protein